MNGKYVLITGGTNGIGLAAARELSQQGARIGLVARNRAKAEKVAADLAGAADIFEADLTSQASIRTMVADVADRAPAVDVLVNNAGAIYGTHQRSPDGIELTWALNVLAPYLITNLLTDHLAPGGRVIMTVSDEHAKAKRIDFDDLTGKRFYSTTARMTGGPLRRYGETKLATILLTAELARRGVQAYSFEPGLVSTGFNTNNGRLMKVMMAMTKPFAKTPEQGAETLVWLAAGADAEPGGYYSDKKLTQPSAAARDQATAERLWQTCAEQTALPK